MYLDVPISKINFILFFYEDLLQLELLIFSLDWKYAKDFHIMLTSGVAIHVILSKFMKPEILLNNIYKFSS
jgi:hypothetical protein